MSPNPSCMSTVDAVLSEFTRGRGDVATLAARDMLASAERLHAAHAAAGELTTGVAQPPLRDCCALTIRQWIAVAREAAKS